MKKTRGERRLWLLLAVAVMMMWITVGEGKELSKEEKEKLMEETKIVVGVISWAEGMDGRTEEALWRLSAHPSVEGLIKIDLCALHRARNSVIESVLMETEKLLEANSTLLLTHLLLVHQNVIFKVEDMEELIYSQKDIVGALSLTKLPPFIPSFIPLKKDVNFCEISPEEYYSNARFPPIGASPLIEVEAMSNSFSLIKLSALKKSRRSFAERGEWFYTSHFDDFFGSINCYPSLKCPSSPSSSSPHNDWLRVMMDQMEEEDFCFARQMRKFGYKTFLLSSLHLTTSHTSFLSYSPSHQFSFSSSLPNNKQQEKQQENGEENEEEGEVEEKISNVKVEFERGEAVIVDNRMKEKKEGRKYVYPTFPAQSARVVIATPLWNMINSETLHKLYVLSQDINIIGRVAVHHENVVIARNKLLRAIEEEFTGEYQYTHVLFIDSDMTFTVKDFETLLQLDKDISFGLAVRRGRYGNPPAYIPLSGDPQDHEPLLRALSLEGPTAIPVKAGGMAFTLIKRKVIDHLRSTLPNGDNEWFWTEHYVDEDSGQEHHFSEDYSFCKRAREYGHEIFLETTVQLGHIDRVPITIKDWLTQIGVNFTPFSQVTPPPPPPTPAKTPKIKPPTQPQSPVGNPNTGNPNTGNPNTGNPNTGNPNTGNPNPNTGSANNGQSKPINNQPSSGSTGGSSGGSASSGGGSSGGGDRPFNPNVPRGKPLSPNTLDKNNQSNDKLKEESKGGNKEGERLPFTSVKDIPVDHPKPATPSPSPQFIYSPLQPQII